MHVWVMTTARLGLKSQRQGQKSMSSAYGRGNAVMWLGTKKLSLLWAPQTHFTVPKGSLLEDHSL